MVGLPAAAQLYVYYRVAPPQAGAAAAAAQALQHELMSKQPGLHCGLLQRADPGAGSGANTVTLMEVYTLEGGIGAALAAEIERVASARMGHLVQGVRHVEVFVPCA